MHWLGLGLGVTWAIRFRELEHSLRHLTQVVRGDPDQELPDAELAEHEHRAAVAREASRRFSRERR